MPGFAVLVEPDEQDAATWSRCARDVRARDRVRRGRLARVVDLLEEADWRVVRVRRPAEIGGAWAAIATSGVRDRRRRDRPRPRRPHAEPGRR